MTNSVPWAVVTADPTVLGVCWIDDDSDADGSEQTITIDGEDYQSDGEPMLQNDWYRYYVTTDSLETGSTIPVDLPDGGAVDLVVPPTSGSMTIGALSDPHWDLPDFTTTEAAAIGNEEPDLLIHVGDWLHNTTEWDERHPTNGDSSNRDGDAEEDMVDLFDTMYPALCGGDGRLVPIFSATSNHETDNFPFRDGGTVLDPRGDDSWDEVRDYASFQYMYPNYAEGDLGPGDYNFGSVVYGNLIQLVALDGHTEDIETTTNMKDWVADELESAVEHILTFSHQPMHPAQERSAGDTDFSQFLQQQFPAVLADYPQWDYHIAGHIHSSTWTHEMAVTDTDPGGDRISIDDGRYITRESNADSEDILTTYRELGEGWRNSNRGDPPNRWTIDKFNRNEGTMFVIEVEE